MAIERDDLADGQDGEGNWWNEIRREENPGELEEIRAKLVDCPRCGTPSLWTSYPYWHVFCECEDVPATKWYDEPEDAVDEWNSRLSK